MHKSFKKLFCLVTAASLSAGVLSLAACGGASFTPVKEDKAEHVYSNGGFVVSTDDYYYFINGVETNQADNTYGKVVKGALMRISKADLAKLQEKKNGRETDETKNGAEVVIPSLMVTGDYNTASGICIYGGRIYYTTPNNVQNTAGEIDRDYLDFKSVKTDGSDLKSHFRLNNNTSEYRFVTVDDTVYVIYLESVSGGTNIHSRNLTTGKDTVLVKGASKAVMNGDDVSDPWIYYTMGVTDGLDGDGSSITYQYNQVYRVCANATKSAYEYTWDKEWLDEHDGEAPYLNYGEIVLDGIGAIDSVVKVTQFNHDVTEENKKDLPRIGYTYTLQSYSNDGLYFVRKLYAGDESVGSTGELYFLPKSAIAKGKSVDNNRTKKENGALDIIASATNTSNASEKAMFYLDEAGHHYLYENSGYIYRVDVNADGTVSPDNSTEIAYDAASASFIMRDASGSDYKYLYYSVSNQSGRSVHRAVYNGEKSDYGNLEFEGSDNALYAPVKLLDVQHANSWYDYEIIGNTLFYANAEALGSNSYNYVYTVDLAGKNGVMTNREIKDFNEKYEELTDSTDGYFAKASTEVSANYATALRYFFYTGSVDQFKENIRYSIEEGGRKETYLYTQKEQDAFYDYAKGENATGDTKGKFLDENGVSYRTLSYFTNFIGKRNEADSEAIAEHWKTTLRNYEIPETEEESLPWWAWTLIGVGIGAIVAAGVLTAVFVLRKKKAEEGEERPEKLRVDTTDDRTVDVYASDEEGDGAASEKPETAEEAEAAEPIAEETIEEVEPVADGASAETEAEQPTAETEPKEKE